MDKHKHKQQTEIKDWQQRHRDWTQQPWELSEYQVVKFLGFWAPSLPLAWTVGCVRLMNTKSLIWIDRSPTESDKNIHFPTKFKTSQRWRSSKRKGGVRKVVGIKFPFELTWLQTKHLNIICEIKHWELSMYNEYWTVSTEMECKIRMRTLFLSDHYKVLNFQTIRRWQCKRLPNNKKMAMAAQWNLLGRACSS